MTDPTQRFSSRAGNYARYRPAYPPVVIELLEAECGLTSGSIVADVGSGTGLLSELFLANGNPVFAVEPNKEMREAGERRLGRYASFTSVAGTAEATKLGDRSVDFVVAGQAFHWFDPGPTRAEFERILQSGGWVVLLWNEQRTEATPFLADYERLIQNYKTEEYKPFDARSAIRSFFSPATFETASFEVRQNFGFEGLKGRLLSSSYIPEPGYTDHDAMMEDLAKLFQVHQENGEVTFEYDTLVYYGRRS